MSWKEISVDDENIDYYASLRNIYDCTAGKFSSDLMKFAISTGAKYYVYEDGIYTILLGFRMNWKYNKTQYIAFAIKPEYSYEAFKIVAEKTREYLLETKTELVFLSFVGFDRHPMIESEDKVEDIFSIIREAFKEYGLVGSTDYVNKISILRVNE